MGIPLCVICCFSLAAFNICSLCLIFVNVINMCLGDSPWVYPIWDFLGFLNLGGYFLPHYREAFNYYLLKYVLMPFHFVFFWNSYVSNVGAFNIVPEVSEIVLFLLIRFSFSSPFHLFLPFCLPPPYPIFCLHYSTVGSLQSVFYLIFCIIHYILTLFYFFQVLVKPFYIFSILVCRLFICDSILISRFWIIFTIIIQNSLSGRFPISSSFVWFGGHFSCSFTC